MTDLDVVKMQRDEWKAEALALREENERWRAAATPLTKWLIVTDEQCREVDDGLAHHGRVVGWSVTQAAAADAASRFYRTMAGYPPVVQALSAALTSVCCAVRPMTDVRLWGPGTGKRCWSVFFRHDTTPEEGCLYVCPDTRLTDGADAGMFIGMIRPTPILDPMDGECLYAAGLVLFSHIDNRMRDTLFERGWCVMPCAADGVLEDPARYARAIIDYLEGAMMRCTHALARRLIDERRPPPASGLTVVHAEEAA